ncbi:MAG: ISAs1 family transposase [candidate division NC10 bacterium]|nr:ISAs1 family transposase [candidate division NC10 bacterium]
MEDQSKEITAIPALLPVLELSGCIVTMDALGCQEEIAAQGIEPEADSELALKGNQGLLDEAVKDLFDDAQARGGRRPGVRVA